MSDYEVKAILSATISVAGASFHQEALLDVSEGDVVIVKHEPGNAYDPYAYEIVLHKTNKRIGYVPKQLARKIFNTGEKIVPGCINEINYFRDLRTVNIALNGTAKNTRDGKGGGSIAATKASHASKNTKNNVCMIVTSTGRVLGKFISDDGRHTKVSNEDGKLVAYPSDKVKKIYVSEEPSFEL